MNINNILNLTRGKMYIFIRKYICYRKLNPKSMLNKGIIVKL